LDDLALEITPRELKRQLDSGESIAIIDVREPFEAEICRIGNSEPIPMIAIPQALPALAEKAASAKLVMVCHHGVRSMQVVRWLRGRRIAACQSLRGGIDSWSIEIDPQIPRY
jgi:rhodanese-related sulfurtransferase